MIPVLTVCCVEPQRGNSSQCVNVLILIESKWQIFWGQQWRHDTLPMVSTWTSSKLLLLCDNSSLYFSDRFAAVSGYSRTWRHCGFAWYDSVHGTGMTQPSRSSASCQLYMQLFSLTLLYPFILNNMLPLNVSKWRLHDYKIAASREVSLSSISIKNLKKLNFLEK